MFELGKITASAKALEALQEVKLPARDLVLTHQREWEKETDISEEATMLSNFTLSSGVTIAIVTEADPAQTVVLLEEEYQQQTLQRRTAP